MKTITIVEPPQKKFPAVIQRLQDLHNEPVTLHMTGLEAAVLTLLSGSVTGLADATFRKVTNKIYHALRGAGFDEGDLTLGETRPSHIDPPTNPAVAKALEEFLKTYPTP